MPVKVSVIVPVYNPGPYIEDCLASLLRQSLPPDEYEVIFVDDGSTDATPALLDAAAAEDPRIRVVHQENSGWAGKPRNVGIDVSRGEYVMFVDNDDHLGDEALERMYAYGVANAADVVVGKMAYKGRSVPVELFRTNRPHATVENAPLIDSLTPHKMLRRAFLDRTGLRFPEGRRRLEDHVFVTEAYLRADNVSVLSDYVCYYHVRRDDAANAGFRRFDPVGYFKNLREALDVVERYTEPGPLRDGCSGGGCAWRWSSGCAANASSVCPRTTAGSCSRRSTRSSSSGSGRGWRHRSSPPSGSSPRWPPTDATTTSSPSRSGRRASGSPSTRRTSPGGAACCGSPSPPS